MNGWIKAYRDWEQHPIINKSPNHFRIWFHLVSNAAYKNKEYYIDSGKITLERGQLVSTYQEISNVTRVPTSTVKDIIKLFEKCQLIHLSSSRKKTIISVIYGDFQKEQPVRGSSEVRPKSDHSRALKTVLYEDSEKKVRPKSVHTPSRSGPLNKKEERNNNIDIYSVPIHSVNNLKGAREEIPTIDEVRSYCLERNNGIDAQDFIDYYAASGWRIRGEAVRDWRALIRRWEQRERQRKKANQFQNFEQRTYDFDVLEDVLTRRRC